MNFVRLFNPQFSRMVASGKKRQTIRPTPKRMPQPGDTIDCREWTGKPYRSKQRRLRIWPILRVSTIEIEPYKRLTLDWCTVRLNNRWLSEIEEEAFAKADGFENMFWMADWFKETYGLPFRGILICW